MARARQQPAVAHAKPAGGRVQTAVLVAGIVIGLCLVGYYPASEFLDALNRARTATEVDEAAEGASSETIAELFAQARAYNQQLAGLEPDIDADDIWPYEEQLALTGHNTAFGYVIIPDISLTMPIYHGTSNSALAAGAGHLETSSLPIGGESTHSVITAHSGMSGMRAFDDIQQLEVGDVFGINVLGTLICYEVTSTEVIEPDELDSLAIEIGEDLCTLVTCTPYGVNTHRYLVHGTRCAVPDDFDGSVSSPLASVLASERLRPYVIALAIALALVVMLVAYRLHRRRANRKLPAQGGTVGSSDRLGQREGSSDEQQRDE